MYRHQKILASIVFDYEQEIATWNVSYIAVRDFGQLPRFSNDPAFSLVFINRLTKISTVE